MEKKMNRMQRVRRKYAINRNKKKRSHVWGQAKQRQSRKRGFTHARGDLLTSYNT